MAETATQVELDGQYRAMREEAGQVTRSRAVLVVRGPDAAEYLQGQLTNEVEALEPGTGCYAALLDRKGHLQADLRLLRVAPDEIWLDLEHDAAPAAVKHLRTYSIGRDVAIEDAAERRAIVSVIGPLAAERAGVESRGPEHSQRTAAVGGTDVLAVATDLGVDLVVEAEALGAVTAALESAGIPAVSEEAAEIVRIESGRPRFGLDMGPESMPAEAGIVERAVNFEKGCYIGQEPVARLHYRGKPNRRLLGLRLSGTAAAGTPLLLGERQVGTLGSICLSPAHGPIGLAIVRREAGPGDTLAVGDAGVTAEVVELPFTA